MRRIIYLVFFIILTIPLIGQTIQDSLLTDFFQQAITQGKIAGVHAIVAKNGELVYSKTFGYADIEKQIPLESDAIYRIASMTKIVTTIAALQLWEKGLFQLDDPVSKYLPVFEKATVLKKGMENQFEPPYETEPLERQPTLEDLFRHTAGIWGGNRYTVAGLRNWEGSLQGFVERLVSVPLATQPGTKFQYSYALDVIGLLIEKWSGQPLDIYFKEHIFDPLGLKDTGFVISEDNLHRLPNHYTYQDGQLIFEEGGETSPFLKRSQALSGGGGWYYSYPGLLTSAKDWLTIMELIRNDGTYNGIQLLKPGTVKMMCEDHLRSIPGAFEPGAGYGLGIGVVIDGLVHGKGASTGTVYWAGGPHNTYFYIDFEKGLSAAMFMQTGPFGLDNIMNEFRIRSQKVFGNSINQKTQ